MNEKRIKALKDLFDGKSAIENEMANVEAMGVAAQAEKNEILAKGQLDADASASRLTLLEGRMMFVGPRIRQLQDELRVLETKIGEASDACFSEIHAAIDEVELSRFRRFCSSVAPYLEMGCANRRFFHPDPHFAAREIPAVIAFSHAEAKRQLDSLRHRLGPAHPQFNFDAVSRAKTILAHYGEVPSPETDLAPKRIYDESAHREVVKLSLDSEFCETLHMIRPKTEANKRLWCELNRKAYSPPPPQPAPEPQPESALARFRKRVAGMMGSEQVAT